MLRSTCFLFCCFISSAVQAQTTDKQGRKQGYWKKTDEKTKKLLYEGMFKDDKPVGTFKYYYPNDSIKAVMTFRSAGSASYAKLYHPSGKRMAEGPYAGKDIKDSIWTYYDEEGMLLSRETYVKGLKEGKSYVYTPDGQISEEKTFRSGKEEGAFKQYYEPNKPKTIGTFKAGKLEGRAVYLYPNGVEAAAGYYREGLKNGPWIYRDSNGKVTERELYKNGELASEKETTEFFEKNKIKDTQPPPQLKKK